MNDDGRADTLRLLFATPRRWLADGCDIEVDHAPTAFGEVSIHAHSDLKHNRVEADVTLPERAPDRTLLRFRLPDHQTYFAEADGHPLPVQNGDTFDLSGLKGKVHVIAKVRRGLTR